MHDAVVALGRGNALFAIKAGLLTVILCIPSFLKTTAAFAYGVYFHSPFSEPPLLHTESHYAAHRFVWGMCVSICRAAPTLHVP